MQPDLSIIIPVYNGVSHIKGCLDSILHQNQIENFEIIVVNDGSTDNSRKIIQEYAMRHDNITPINQSNKGVSWARNKGIEHSHGKYLTFVDVDDKVGVSYDSIKDSFHGAYNNIRNDLRTSNRKLTKKEEITYTFEKDYFVKMLSVTGATKPDVAFAGKFTVNYDEAYIRQHVYLQDTIYGNSAAEKEILLDHAEKRESANFAMYRRDFLENHNLYFQSEMRLDEDIFFCMQAVLYAQKVATVAGAIYLYNRHANTLSNISGKLASEHKYTTARIQRYSAFLNLIIDDKRYSDLFNVWLKQFAQFRDRVNLCNRYYFPSITCNQCSNKTCETCFMKEREVYRIQENIAEFLPNFVPQHQNQKVR